MKRNDQGARFVCACLLTLLVGCAYEEMKIVAQTGGAHATGGKSGAGASSQTGGSSSGASSSTGGVQSTGGAPSTGGSKSSTQATGGKSAAGGTQATGGTKAIGGTSPVGGTTSAIATGGAATGGIGAAGGTSPTTSSTAIGGVTSVGGTHATGGMPTTGGTTSTGAVSTTPLTGGVSMPNQYYDQGGLKGYVWASNDQGGSTITIAAGEMCAIGNLIQVPSLADGGYDYNLAWGAQIGWNINQAPAVDGGPGNPAEPANLSGIASITVGLKGAAGLTLRIQFSITETDGTFTTYCSALPDGGGTVSLGSMTKDCWNGGGTPLDPATFHPPTFAISFVSDTSSAHSFNVCVTELKFNPTGAL
jgi:hypothetical protein